MNKLTIIVFSLIPICMFGSEFADSHIRSAEALVEIQGGKESYEFGLREGLKSQLQINPQLAKFQDVMERWFAEYLPWENFKPKMVEIVCEAYSEEEIEALIDFYKSEVGAKLLEKGDEVALKTMNASQRLAMENQIQLNLMLRERMKELELEVKNFFPEWSESTEDEDSLEKEYSISRSNSFSGSSLEEFAYPLKGSKIRSLPDFNPFKEIIPVQITDALKSAYSDYYQSMDILIEDFEKEASIAVETYEWKPDSEDIEPLTIRFYKIDVGMIFRSGITDPPAVIVLSDGSVLAPKKKTK